MRVPSTLLGAESATVNRGYAGQQYNITAVGFIVSQGRLAEKPIDTGRAKVIEENF